MCSEICEGYSELVNSNVWVWRHLITWINVSLCHIIISLTWRISMAKIAIFAHYECATCKTTLLYLIMMLPYYIVVLWKFINLITHKIRMVKKSLNVQKLKTFLQPSPIFIWHDKCVPRNFAKWLWWDSFYNQYVSNWRGFYVISAIIHNLIKSFIHD